MLEIITYIALVSLVTAVFLMCALVFSRLGQFYPHHFNILRISLFGCIIVSAAIFYSLAAARFFTTHGLDFLGHKVAASSVIVTFLASVLYWTGVFHYPTWTAGRDFAIENGRNAGG
jgi:phosphoglycerol transferase MdoB-like AlkP superfamily enzyme